MSPNSFTPSAAVYSCDHGEKAHCLIMFTLHAESDMDLSAQATFFPSLTVKWACYPLHYPLAVYHRQQRCPVCAWAGRYAPKLCCVVKFHAVPHADDGLLWSEPPNVCYDHLLKVSNWLQCFDNQMRCSFKKKSTYGLGVTQICLPGTHNNSPIKGLWNSVNI